MNDECTITFEGTRGGTYYVACNLVGYINEELVNTGSSQIVLYSDIQQGTNQNNITIPALSYPYFTSGTTRTYITNASNVSFNFTASYFRERDVVEIVLIGLVATLSLIHRLLGR